MTNEIMLDWSKRIKIDKEYFPEDKLGRVKYANFLTKLLASEGYDTKRDERERNYVLNLNAEWGAGKTYFLKRWSEDLKNRYPVVYVDAWRKDYSDDPLMTVISSIIEQLREQAGKSANDSSFQVPNKLIGLLKAAAPSITRGLCKRYIGIDPLEVMNAENNSDIGNLKTEDGKDVKGDDGKNIDMSFAASETVKYLIDEHNAKTKAIDSLKKSVYDWVKAVIGLKNKSLPAFIFIDELDRCRPSYAVEMLETIKHIFDIKGVVFVVATDTEQLQHAVKAVYGVGFDAKVYLGRFFNSRYSLKAPNLDNLLEVHSDAKKLSGDYLEAIGVDVMPFNKDEIITLKNISIVLDAFKVSARVAIQITDRIITTTSNMPRGSKIDLLMLATLLCIKEKNSNIYDEIVKGGFQRKETIGQENKTTYLSDYFKNSINDNILNRYIEMDIEPSVRIPAYKDKTHSHEKKNEYPQGAYEFTLMDYLEKVFSIHFKSVKPQFNLRSKNNEQTELEKIYSELNNLYRNNRNSSSLMVGDAAVLWFKFFYIHDNFKSVTRDDYKDFVELASPLDWMGKDELKE